MDINFIRIGDNFINIAKIERIQIKNREKIVRMYTDELMSGMGDDGTGVENMFYDYKSNSPEAQALLAWLRDRTTDLTPPA